MPTVLSTKKLSSSQKNLLLNAGIGFVDYDAIKVKMLTFDPKQIISQNYIFTSKNAVRSALQTLEPALMANSKIFCVGEKTAEFIQSSGFSVEASASYGADLAEKLVTDYRALEFTYFCGKIRSDELPEILQNNGVNFREIPVYVTTLNEQGFNREFEGILLYSPSGVESFCSKNDLTKSVAFCIGITTASVAEKFSKNIKIATKPSIENLIVQVVKYFK